MDTLATETRGTPPTPLKPTRFPILFGPNGLRAGWSVLVFVVVTVGLLYLFGFELRWFARDTHQSLPGRGGGKFYPAIAMVAEAATLLAVVLATALMAWFEHRRVVFYGLVGRHRLRQFFLGFIAGFAFLSLLVGILIATHHLVITRAALPSGTLARYALAWVLFFLIVGITEEFMLRGYLLFTLARGIHFWPAAFILAAAFGLLHTGNHGESPFGIAAAALIALVFSLSLWRLGHLWWAIGFHASWDWAESYFYGTADSGTVSAGRLMHAHPAGSILLSGGATGPEGSAWVLLVVALAALLVWFTQPHYGIRLASKASLPASDSIQP